MDEALHFRISHALPSTTVQTSACEACDNHNGNRIDIMPMTSASKTAVRIGVLTLIAYAILFYLPGF
jgi:hypothetical protein